MPRSPSLQYRIPGADGTLSIAAIAIVHHDTRKGVTVAEGEVVDETVEVDDARRGWWLLAFVGLLSVIFGLLLVFWPGPTITTVTSLIGLFMVIAGVMRFFVAVFDSESHWMDRPFLPNSIREGIDIYAESLSCEESP